MVQEKWTNLVKGSCSNHYNLNVLTTIRFSSFAFDYNEEALVAVDNNGIAYYIDLSHTPAYRKLGSVGSSTCLAFNPGDRNELFICLNSTNIKVLKIRDINDFCLLTGHTASVINISFYKDYCLTTSSKEVIIWQIKTYCKVHQLHLHVKSIVIKKGIFSNLGLVALLYESNVIQSWIFQQFDKDNRISVEKFGLKNVKDFEFTKDGRAMIVCGSQDKVLVFNTLNYNLIKTVDLCQNFNGGRQLSAISQPLDGGANSVLAILTTDCILKFLNLAKSSIVDNCCESLTGIKKILVSDKGRYLASTNKHGCLDILLLNNILDLNLNYKNRKKKEPKKTHKSENYLNRVHRALKEELKLPRLLPILKEFGEYPEKHRRLIWTIIMELPDNKKAYVDLSNKIESFDIVNNDFIFNKSKNLNINITLSRLYHWCPVLAECSFLPKLLSPFLNVFQHFPILGFEASMFIIFNFCQKWFEYHPLPPLNILGMIENILLEADPLLFNYFCEQGITASDYAWPLLQTTLKEVLGMNDWLIMWDHILSLCKPWFLILCAVAYNILYRKIITTKLKTLDDFQQFYRTRGHVSIKSILKTAHKLDSDTSHQIHPQRYLKKEINIIPKEGPYPPFFQFEFPKYLTNELRGLNLKKLKERERHLRGLQLNTMDVVERQRLRTEKDYFLKRLEEARLNEIRNCYENQVLSDKKLLEYTRKQIEGLDPYKYLHNIKWSDLNHSYDESTYMPDFKRKRRKSKQKNCKLLQEQVDQLEFEVQNLLTKLYNKSSRTNSKI